ncbi:MAG: hypothetical protein [Olavius algarvensis Gamma 1 endosymbiont]|nr:MAG: hypothetical protein [Olavius algarvensis Gamma 1 endosymbiont]
MSGSCLAPTRLVACFGSDGYSVVPPGVTRQGNPPLHQRKNL